MIIQIESLSSIISIIFYINDSIAESFYYVKYGSSIIKSKIPSKILSKKTGISRNIVCFGILIHVLSWRQQKHKCLCFRYFWRNNWLSIFDIVERLCSCLQIQDCIQLFGLRWHPEHLMCARCSKALASKEKIFLHNDGSSVLCKVTFMCLSAELTWVSTQG
mgnify:CR=1 FL=1